MPLPNRFRLCCPCSSQPLFACMCKTSCEEDQQTQSLLPGPPISLMQQFLCFTLGYAPKSFQRSKCREIGTIDFPSGRFLSGNVGLESMLSEPYRPSFAWPRTFWGSMTFAILRCNRLHLYQGDSPRYKTLMMSIGSLYLTYEPEYYYWEVVEMIRKMMLTGAVQMVGSGTTVQALFAALICFVHWLVLIKFRIYICSALILRSFSILISSETPFCCHLHVVPFHCEKESIDSITKTQTKKCLE